MFKTYFKTALRNFARHKSNSIINVSGLTVGFAAFLLIFLIVQYEESFDRFHTNKDEIYRVVRIGRNPENREYRPGVPFPVTSALRADLPQLKNAAAVYCDYNVPIAVIGVNGSLEKKFKEKNVLAAEPEFFRIFDFGLAAGNIQTALTDVNTVLLTKEIAKKYFGDWQSAIGKSIRMYGQAMKVTGILKDPPPNTDFPLGIVASYVSLTKNMDPNDWGSISDANYCFVQLNKNASSSQFMAQIDQFTEKHIKPVNPGYTLALEPLKEIHYDERYGNFTGRIFSKDLILALSVIGLFLLIIACVNFINITTAQAINRSREVGIRKVLGSNRVQLIVQFLGETGITTLLALIGSVVIVLTCLPLVNDLMDIHLSAAQLTGGRFMFLILTAFVLVTFLSGFYPALVLSAYKSIQVLKSAVTANRKGVSLRRGLVVFQFVIAQVLIIGTWVVASQMNFFRHADMGFNKDAIINANFPGDSLSRTKIDFLHNELMKINGVKNVSFSTFAPSAADGWYTDLRKMDNLHSKEADMVISMKPADTGYFRLYNLPLVAGRIYYPADTMSEFVVNETVIKRLGMQDPAKAIGYRVNVSGTSGTIVGVVKDFHTNSLRDAIGPIAMTPFKRAYGLANIQVDMTKSKEVIAALQNTWNKYYPEYLFEYSFIDQEIADYYSHENQLSILYKIFSGIAIFISCLGLYGLISFMAVQRKKEIGIRKVLGAPVRDIVVMLSREFSILIGVAFLIASPIAWYYMNHWLQQYSYRISVSSWFFIATLAGSLVLAWITVSYTAIKAALANPMKSLRTE